MDTYSFLRQFADSWVLLAMTAFYIGAIIWVFRPGARKTHDEISQIPLRNDVAADVRNNSQNEALELEATK